MAENNYANKVPTGYSAMPDIYPQNACPFPSTISTRIYYTHHLTDHTQPTPNGIQIQLAVLPQYTLQTDRQTDKSYGTMRHFRSGKNTRWK